MPAARSGGPPARLSDSPPVPLAVPPPSFPFPTVGVSRARGGEVRRGEQGGLPKWTPHRGVQGRRHSGPCHPRPGHLPHPIQQVASRSTSGSPNTPYSFVHLCTQRPLSACLTGRLLTLPQDAARLPLLCEASLPDHTPPLVELGHSFLPCDACTALYPRHS